MSENLDVLNSRDDIYLVFTERKSKFSFYFTLYLFKICTGFTAKYEINSFIRPIKC